MCYVQYCFQPVSSSINPYLLDIAFATSILVPSSRQLQIFCFSACFPVSFSLCPFNNLQFKLSSTILLSCSWHTVDMQLKQKLQHLFEGSVYYHDCSMHYSDYLFLPRGILLLDSGYNIRNWIQFSKLSICSRCY